MKAIKFLGLTLLLGACASPQPKDYYEIVGEVKNVEDSTIIHLGLNRGRVASVIATDTIIDGKFYFKIKPDSLAKDNLSLMCHKSDKFPGISAQLWASAGDYVKVTGENTLIYTWKIKGNAPEIASLQTYINDSRELWDEFQRNNILQRQIRAKSRTLPKEESMPLKQTNDSLEAILDNLKVQIDANEIRRMKQSEVDEVWLDKLRGLAQNVKYAKGYPYKEEAINLYNRLSEDQKQTPQAQEAYTNLFPPQHVEKGGGGKWLTLISSIYKATNIIWLI